MPSPPSAFPYLFALAIGAMVTLWQGESITLIAAAAFGYGYRAWQETEHFHRCVAWCARLIDRLAGVR